MQRHRKRLQRSVGEDPFTTLEGLLLAGFVVGLVVGGLLLTPADASVVARWGLRAATALVAVGLGGLVLALLAHGAHDLWVLATADSGERFPETLAGLARAGWRLLETVAVVVYAVSVPFSLWVIADLPNEEAAGTFFFAFGGYVVFATLVFLVIVGTRIVGTALYRVVRALVVEE